MPHQFRCHGCGRLFPHKPGVDLYCSQRCQKADAKLLDKIAGQLKAKGFKQHPQAANLWLKNGVGVTTHEVKHHGLVETLQRHAAASGR